MTGKSSPEGAATLTTVHVHRALDGDEESLTWVVGRLSPLLLAQARYRLGSTLRPHYDPEDLVNEAWMVALPRLGDLVHRGGRLTPVLLRYLSQTLLFKINNLVKKHIRSEVRRKQVAPDSSADDLDLVNQLPADMSGVVTQAVRHEQQSAVTAALEKLDSQDQEILLLRGIEQQSNQTVSLLLGLTPQAVSMRFSRALERLQKQLPGSIFDEISIEVK